MANFNEQIEKMSHLMYYGTVKEEKENKGNVMNIKEGAVYPVAIMLTKEGEARNPFAAFDEEQ